MSGYYFSGVTQQLVNSRYAYRFNAPLLFGTHNLSTEIYLKALKIYFDRGLPGSKVDLNLTWRVSPKVCFMLIIGCINTRNKFIYA